MAEANLYGDTDFSATVWRGCYQMIRYEIQLLWQPDRAVGRKEVIQKPPVKAGCQRSRIFLWSSMKNGARLAVP